MTGIIQTYEAFELGREAMSEGFFDLGNLETYMGRTVFLPVEKEGCRGEWERRRNGQGMCKLEVTSQLLLEMARDQMVGGLNGTVPGMGDEENDFREEAVSVAEGEGEGVEEGG